MNLNKKVIVLLPGFPKDETDQNCLPYVQDLMMLLSSTTSPESFEVIALHYPFERRTYHWNGIKVNAMGGKNIKWPFRLSLWIQCLKKLNELSKNNIGLIHCFWLSESALIAQIFSKIKKTPILVTIIGQDPLKSNKYLKFLDLSKLKLVGISSFVGQKLLESRHKNIDDVIPLIWNEETLNKHSDIQTESFDILGVGNLSDLKNYKLFIEVVELVNKQQKIKAAIVGSGYQISELQSIINDKGLDSCIKLLGELDRNQIFALMKNSKVLLHTSRYESQGFAMSEALYFGMRVVSTNVADNAENEYIEVGSDKKELSELVLNSLENFERKPHTFYKPEKAVEQYLNMYQSLM